MVFCVSRRYLFLFFPISLMKCLYMYVYMYVCVCVCVNVRIYVCVCVCVCVYNKIYKKMLFFVLSNRDMIVNLYKLHFISSHFSSQPNTKIFHPSTFSLL